LWKRRNAYVFRDEELNLRKTLISCKTEVVLCRVRMPKKNKKVIEEWTRKFDSLVNALPI
jgi:hypothetical protein